MRTIRVTIRTGVYILNAIIESADLPAVTARVAKGAKR